MDSKLSWFMQNPAIYLGTILLLTFGGEFILGYIRDCEFYVFIILLDVKKAILLTNTF
ncbi:hypothetical protein ACQJ18_22900 [Priestia megaterium]|uniref:hypothetical protein n=1 Tax=Priestia megaterium TaxID=1404 RepID=UPI003D014006